MTNKELLNKRLKRYIDAEEAVLLGQAYTIGGRTLTRANLSTIRKAIEYLISCGASIDDEEKAKKPMYIKRILPID